VADVVPVVSVVIPAFNRAHFVADAIASAHAQDVEAMEIVVVDDGSTDDTAGVVASSARPVRYVRQEHGGVSRARNRGLAEARAGLIAFLDSDDVWPAGSLRHRLDVLAAHPEADLVYGKAQLRRQPGAPRIRLQADDEVVAHPSFGSILARRSAYERVGGFDETFRGSEDVDWWCRAQERGLVIVRTDEVVLEYRLHGGNMTAAVDANRRFLFRALKQSLDRRRGGERP
jgi:glycosyltransferase involved in cell wall biosynthesis